MASASSEPPSVGSLGKVTAGIGRTCTPLTGNGRTYTTVSSGWTALYNDAASDVTIKQVTMINPHGIKVTGAQVLPITKHATLMGNVRGHRVPANAEPARGASIGPGGRAELIVDLTFQPGHGGSGGPVQVLYTDTEGSLHQFVGGVWFRFTTQPKCT